MAHHWSMNMTIISMRGDRRHSEWSCPNRNVTTRVHVTGRHWRQSDTRITHGKKKSWEQVGWQIDDEYSLLLPYPSWLLPTRGNVLTELLVTERLRPGLTSDDAGCDGPRAGGQLRTNTWWLQPSVVFHRWHSAHLPSHSPTCLIKQIKFNIGGFQIEVVNTFLGGYLRRGKVLWPRWQDLSFQ